MSKLFDEELSDEDTGIKTNNEFAKNYDSWRKKEELHKLKTKFGDDPILSDDGSSSSSDDEEPIEDEESEKKFLKTLSCLIAKKDPVEVYKHSPEGETEKKKKKEKKPQPMTIRDYERKLILEKGGILSDEEGDIPQKPAAHSYTEEQRQLKDNLKSALNTISESDEDETFMLREQNKDKVDAGAEYTSWLTGQKQHLEDEELESELEPLKEYWNNPKLDENEKFLRDYFLNKRYLESEDQNHCPRYDEVIHDSDQDLSEDEKEIEEAEQFEYKYNFRFEEPDPEFIKTYPRTMQNSLRRSDDRRKVKRAEIKERKSKEKKEKMDELKQLQELKRLEIEEKIAKLKKVAGDTDVTFSNEDVDGDFDPEMHDKRMQMLFNDEFYQGPEDEQKPTFPDLDEELEIENWNKWEGNKSSEEAEDQEINEPHCENTDFVMDCDYDPEALQKKDSEDTRRGKKKRKRRSKFAEAISKPKPIFDPNDKTYEAYIDEYYKLDCEDIIDDIPCRFKYRKVVPNSFGLTIEEILMANDRELNKWCSLKKTFQRRPDVVEKYEQHAYSKKGQNIDLKRKILPSLFKDEDEQKKDSDNGNAEDSHKIEAEVRTDESPKQRTVDVGAKIMANSEMKKRKRKRDKRNISPEQQTSDYSLNDNDDNLNLQLEDNLKLQVESEINKSNTKKNKKAKRKQLISPEGETNPDDNLKNKSQNSQDYKMNNKQKVKRQKLSYASQDGTSNSKRVHSSTDNKKKNTEISDSRLLSFGYNPKKYKNTLKYKNEPK